MRSHIFFKQTGETFEQVGGFSHGKCRLEMGMVSGTI